MRRRVRELLLMLVIAIVIGIGSVLWALDQSRSRGVVTIGPWIAARPTGTADRDPYIAALTAAAPNLWLGTAEGLAFTARTDSAGDPISGRCDYRIDGNTPAAQLWTLTAYDADGRLMFNAAGRTGFHSREILRRPDGSFAVALSAQVQPGNWLPVRPVDDLQLVLRLYDTALTTGLGNVTPTMPSITRGDCR